MGTGRVMSEVPLYLGAASNLEWLGRAPRYRVNVAHIRPSPESSIGFQAKVVKPFEVVPGVREES